MPDSLFCAKYACFCNFAAARFSFILNVEVKREQRYEGGISTMNAREREIATLSFSNEGLDYGVVEESMEP